MSRKAWLAGGGALALAAAGFYGYRALGTWLTAQMTGKIKPPEIAPPASGRSPSPPEAGAVSSEPATAEKTPAQALSSLDLIVKSAASAPASGAAMSPQQLATVRQAGLSLVDSLKPLLNDPTLTSRLSPDQAKQYRQLMTLLNNAENAAKSDGPLDVRQMAADVQKAQQLSLTLMSQLPQEKPKK